MGDAKLEAGSGSATDTRESVRVEPIDHPRDTVRFVKTWWRVYRDDPQWVPPLIFERKQFFDPAKNPYFRAADSQSFIAYRSGEALGTISATIDHYYQEHEPGVGFFGFFEFVDDLDVARALLDAASGWLRGRGMHSAIGPFNLNTNHEFGLLVDGFDTPPYVANPHNSEYFQTIYGKLGLEKAMDWYAYKILPDSAGLPRIAKVAKRFVDGHPEIQIRSLDKKNYQSDAMLLHKIYDDAWEHNWGHSRISLDEFLHLADGFKGIIDTSLCFVAEIEGQVAAISVTLPDYNQVVKQMNGRLFPFGWWKFLRGGRSIDTVRVFMLGVAQEFQHLPLGAPLYWKTWERCLEMGIREAEASLVLENNTRMRSALERMGAEIYKTYRTYEYSLS
jgi:GNAT superfamily N-acetyltransferase